MCCAAGRISGRHAYAAALPTLPVRSSRSLPRCRTRSKPCSLKKLHNSTPEKTRSLGMRYFELFDSNFAFVQPATNLRLIRTLQPQFDCFFDHFFRVLRRFALTDDAEFGAVRHIQSILSRLDHSGKFRKFHDEEFTSLCHSPPIGTLMALICRKIFPMRSGKAPKALGN